MGSLVTAFGDVMGGQSESDMYSAQARIAKANARTMEQNAGWTMAAGENDVFNQGLKNRQIQGTIRARQAASGVDVNSGSASKVQQSARQLGQLDAMTVQSNAARAAYGYKEKAREYRDQAAIDLAAANNANASGWLKAYGDIEEAAGKAMLAF